MATPLAVLCDRPDYRGAFNRRCQRIIDQPRGEDAPRQCRAAAQRGTDLCCVHQPAAMAPYPFCQTPSVCAGKGYCPRDIACNE